MSDDHEKVPLTAEPANVDEPEEEGPATGSSKTVGLFSDRKPKNVWAGFASGAKNLGKGVACGVAAFVALPVHGFRTEGIKGGAKGLLAGTACLAGLSVGGVYTGVRQVIRGVANTPEYVRESLNNESVWDPLKREWSRPCLKAMRDSIPNTDDDLYAAARRAVREEVRQATDAPPEQSAESKDEVNFYTLLGIPKDADNAAIKRAYVTKALVCHPDKNPGNPQATALFQKVNQAYAVLSNPATRLEYDLSGSVSQDPSQEFHHPIESLVGGRRVPGVDGAAQTAVVP